MKNLFIISIASIFSLSVSAQCHSSSKVMVGNTQMTPNKNIIENAVQSNELTTLVAAVKAADLVETLQGHGPFTVLAPGNDAFENLPAGTVETLLKPENKSMLQSVLTYHVLPGSFKFSDVQNAIRHGNGMAKVMTVQGHELTFLMNGDRNIVVKDALGNVSNITTYDVVQSNGVIHVIDSVLLPA